MKSWQPRRPTPSTLGDHDVHLLGDHLRNRHIALLVCGGIAAMKTPLLARALRREGAKVTVYVSSEALKYVALDALEWASDNPVISTLSPRSEHLSKEQPFDAYLVAPATYNTLNKFRYGIADTPVTTTLASALALLEKGETQILVAPTMHGDLHNSILQESLETLRDKGVWLIPPRDDNGKHNLPENDLMVASVCAAVSRSPLRQRKFLVTAGCTPAPIDSVRRITNRFRGRLGIEIARELILRGADVKLILGAGSVAAPAYIPKIKIRDFAHYRDTVLETLKTFRPQTGIFSAAVADYLPKSPVSGKIPSGTIQSIDLVAAEKVIDLVAAQAPDLNLISFKYQENMTHEELIRIAKDRLGRGHRAVVANRGEELTDKGEQIAHLVTDTQIQKLLTKSGIARGLVDYLETLAPAAVLNTKQPRGLC